MTNQPLTDAEIDAMSDDQLNAECRSISGYQRTSYTLAGLQWLFITEGHWMRGPVPVPPDYVHNPGAAIELFAPYRAAKRLCGVRSHGSHWQAHIYADGWAPDGLLREGDYYADGDRPAQAVCRVVLKARMHEGIAPKSAA